MSKARTSAWLALSVAALSVAALLVGAALEPASAQPARPNGVVLLRCSLGVSENTVLAYQKSQEAPTKRSNNCAQALADALRDGFDVEHSEISVDAEQIVYTLIQ